MAANTYTTDDLVNDILLAGHIPLANNTFTATKLLKLATWELQTPIMKQILSTRGGYYMTYEDYVANQSGAYPIPMNATAGALANVELVQGTTIIPVNLMEESEQFSTNSPTTTSYGFYMQGNNVIIRPTPVVGNPRLWFFRRPSELVPVSSCAQITSIAGDVLTVSSLPTDWAVDDEVDLVGDQPPFNIGDETLVTAISGTDVTVAVTTPSVEIGDWICLHNQTCIPQLPVEFRVLLVQRVVVRVYEIQGYLDKMNQAKKKLDELEKDTFGLITPRVQSQSKIINPVNGGFLTGGRRQMNFPAGHTP